MLLKSVMSIAVFMVFVLSLPAITLAADGDLDPTFGTAGLVTTDFASIGLTGNHWFVFLEPLAKSSVSQARGGNSLVQPVTPFDHPSEHL